MADDVFALSPISASPALPSEADYEAIRDAFMETSRGRWFLGEYAKRNRNADTSMVLDAVARIEQALAAQQRLQQQQETQAVEDNALPEALAAIRHAVTSAQGAATAALGGFALEQNLSPVRKGIRIIKEISWRWREIGADSRICDLIDSQVVAIEAACDQLAGADPSAALMAAFDMVKAQLDGLDQTVTNPPVTDETGTQPPETALAGAGGESIGRDAEPTSPDGAPAPMATAAEPAAAPPPEITRPVAATSQVSAATPEAGVSAAMAASVEAATAPHAPMVARAVSEAAAPSRSEAPQAISEPAKASPEPVQPTADLPKADVAKVDVAPATSERAEMPVQIAPATTDDDDMDIIVVSKAEADAQDEAILDLVAAEMSVPEPAEEKEFDRSSSINFDIEDPVAVDDDIVATFAEPRASTSQAWAPRPEQPRVVAAPEFSPSPVSLEPRPVPTATAARQAPPVAPLPAPAPQPPALAMHAPVQTMSAVQELARPTPIAQTQHETREQPRPEAATATLHPLPKPTLQPSLGATLIANGLLQRPVAANDPLTPIRRMTQPEKIAFFS